MSTAEKITWLAAVSERLEASGCTCVHVTPAGKIADWSLLGRHERRHPTAEGLMRAVIIAHHDDCPLGSTAHEDDRDAA